MDVCVGGELARGHSPPDEGGSLRLQGRARGGELEGDEVGGGLGKMLRTRSAAGICLHTCMAVRPRERCLCMAVVLELSPPLLARVLYLL